jgi:hypothetical protein
MVTLGNQPGVIGGQERLPLEEDEASTKGKEELVPC